MTSILHLQVDQKNILMHLVHFYPLFFHLWNINIRLGPSAKFGVPICKNESAKNYATSYCSEKIRILEGVPKWPAREEKDPLKLGKGIPPEVREGEPP